MATSAAPTSTRWAFCHLGHTTISVTSMTTTINGSVAHAARRSRAPSLRPTRRKTQMNEPSEHTAKAVADQNAHGTHYSLHDPAPRQQRRDQRKPPEHDTTSESTESRSTNQRLSHRPTEPDHRTFSTPVGGRDGRSGTIDVPASVLGIRHHGSRVFIARRLYSFASQAAQASRLFQLASRRRRSMAAGRVPANAP